jgi:DNA helicase HerA-like ATPase
MDDKLFKVPINIAICAPTGAGKTVLAKTILKDNLLKQIDYLIIMSPTLTVNDDFSEYKEKAEPDEYGPAVHKCDTNFAGIIDEVTESQYDLLTNPDNKKKDIPQILIIMDDIIGNSTVRFGSSLDSFTAKSRHYNMSFIFISQRISAISRTIRLNCAIFIVFSSWNYSELETFLEQYAPKKYKSKLREKIMYHLETPYNFILCNNRNNKVTQRMLLNGEKPIPMLDS